MISIAAVCGLVVEIDGDSHGADEAKIYDQKRTHWFKSQGLRVIRFSNRDVLRSMDGVTETLKRIIKKE